MVCNWYDILVQVGQGVDLTKLGGGGEMDAGRTAVDVGRTPQTRKNIQYSRLMLGGRPRGRAYKSRIGHVTPLVIF